MLHVACLSYRRVSVGEICYSASLYEIYAKVPLLPQFQVFGSSNVKGIDVIVNSLISVFSSE